MSQQYSLVVIQPFAVLEAMMVIDADGASEPYKLRIRDDAEFIVTHVDVDLYDQNGRLNDTEHAPFTIALRNTTQNSDFQNMPCSVNALRNLSQSRHFNMLQFSGNQEIELTASHDVFCANNTDVAPYLMRLTFMGFYARYQPV